MSASVNNQTKHKSAAHLIETIGHQISHSSRHLDDLNKSNTQAERDFHYQHARTHTDGAMEHVQKLVDHVRDNYPQIYKEFVAINNIQPKSDQPNWYKATKDKKQESAALRQARLGSAPFTRYNAAPGKTPKLHQPVPNKNLPAPENYS